MAKKLGTPSGFKDVLPAEKIQFNQLMQLLSHTVEKYGFSPIDTPEVEWLETLTGHDDTGGKLIYRVFNGYEQDDSQNLKIDKGLRFDLTVPLARFFGQHSHLLPFPFKRYHWGKVFRGETAQTGKGRYREFYQFDADVIGADSNLADAEIACMLLDGMQQLKLPAKLLINNRLLLDALLEIGNIKNKNQQTAVITAIDKFHKIGLEKVLAEVNQHTNEKMSNLVAQFLQVEGTNQQKLAKLSELLSASRTAKAGIENLSEVVEFLAVAGWQTDVIISPTIVRGLGYYTGIIFETYIDGYHNYGSVASGGRYNNLIAALGGPQQPAVGASFGVSRLLDIMQQINGAPTTQTPAELLIVNFAPELQHKYLQLANKLRQTNIATELTSKPDKLGNQLKKAGKLGIKLAVIIGSSEEANNMAIVKNLQNQTQTEVEQSELIAEIRKMLSL